MYVPRRNGHPRRWPATALLVALATAATVGIGAPAGAQSGGYVAIGDSYASGPLVGHTAGGPAGCLRTVADYPHLVARALGLSLSDVTCGAATTADVEQAQSTVMGVNPAQISALSPSTSLVTLTLGGDDLGFTRIIANCAAATPWGPTRVGATCKSHYDAGGTDQLAAQVQAVAPRVATVLAEVRATAPFARVVVTGYPEILPGGAGCWPVAPFTRTDVPYLRQTEQELNQMLADQAARAGDLYVDLSAASDPHNACADEGQRWIEPLVPHAHAAPFHPNAAGETAMAAAVVQALRASTS